MSFYLEDKNTQGRREQKTQKKDEKQWKLPVRTEALGNKGKSKQDQRAEKHRKMTMKKRQFLLY